MIILSNESTVSPSIQPQTTPDSEMDDQQRWDDLMESGGSDLIDQSERDNQDRSPSVRHS